jgi:hypothetical protein
MPRRPARHTQSDVARAIRAAKQAGAGAVELKQDGSIFIHVAAAPPVVPEQPSPVDDIIL